MGEGAVAADREPAELDREHVEQEDPITNCGAETAVNEATIKT